MQQQIGEVLTTHGRVRGREHPTHTEFLGVQFAGSPYPGRAFDPPSALPASSMLPGSARRWLTPSSRAYRFPIRAIGGDNALNLNVYAPRPSRGKHPVMVWLHGGGFFTGTNASPWWNGGTFARDGIVVVVPNFRVGAEGFAILDGEVTNRGILDIISALRLVQDNVEQFGGIAPG